jgi:hypothetical protein
VGIEAPRCLSAQFVFGFGSVLIIRVSGSSFAVPVRDSPHPDVTMR